MFTKHHSNHIISFSYILMVNVPFLRAFHFPVKCTHKQCWCSVLIQIAEIQCCVFLPISDIQSGRWFQIIIKFIVLAACGKAMNEWMIAAIIVPKFINWNLNIHKQNYWRNEFNVNYNSMKLFGLTQFRRQNKVKWNKIKHKIPNYTTKIQANKRNYAV